jgi:hypothetical protein
MYTNKMVRARCLLAAIHHCDVPTLDRLGLARMVADARELEPSSVDVHKRGGALPVADAAPALAEGAGGIEPAGEAERAAAARPEALASWTQGEAGREAEAPPGEGEQELKAPPLKGRGKPKALPPEGERELDAMPQGNPNEVLMT